MQRTRARKVTKRLQVPIKGGWPQLLNEVHYQRLNAPCRFHREIAADFRRGGEVFVPQNPPGLL